MHSAAALRVEGAFDSNAPWQSRSEVLARYHRMRQIGKHHHSEVMDFIPNDAVFQQARRLGLTHGKTIVLDSPDQLHFATDLAIYTAPADRSRAIDRYANAGRWPPGSEEAAMLEIMRKARFAILLAQRRHPLVGLIVQELTGQTDLWLIDEGLEQTLPSGAAFATRLFAPGPFVMTAGVGVPLARKTLARVISYSPALLRKAPSDAYQDRRFAEAVWRCAIDDGSTERVIFREPGAEDDR
jgi:hypothetical protein